MQDKFQHEQKWKTKHAISVCAAKIAGTILLSTKPAIGNVAVQPQDPQPVQSPFHALTGDINLPLHLHPGPQPPQVEPIQTQVDAVPKVLTIGKVVRRVFPKEENDAWAAHIRGYTMLENLFALLQAESESIIWKC